MGRTNRRESQEGDQMSWCAVLGHWFRSGPTCVRCGYTSIPASQGTTDRSKLNNKGRG